MDLANVVPWGQSFAEYQAMFGLSADDLTKRILGCGDGPASFNAEATQQGADGYIWDSLSSVEALGRVRMQAMTAFLADFDAGCQQGRYLPASLPSLPFPDSGFDLALCSHYLFLYSDHVDELAHLSSMRELCRVASEVRVFPVISLDGETSRHLDSVMTALAADGFDVSLQAVSYRFQKGATEMLVAKSR